MKIHTLAALAAIAITATAATESYTLTGPVNQAIVIPAAKAGLTRVDFAATVVVNGILVVNNQTGVPQNCSPTLTLNYIGLPFGNSGVFSAWQTWPVGQTSTSGFGFTDVRGVSYTSNLAIWQSPSTYTANATAVAGGTLPVGVSASGLIDPSSRVTLNVTYTYDPLPAVGPKKRK